MTPITPSDHVRAWFWPGSNGSSNGAAPRSRACDWATTHRSQSDYRGPLEKASRCNATRRSLGRGARKHRALSEQALATPSPHTSDSTVATCAATTSTRYDQLLVEDVAREYVAFPVRMEGDNLFIAVAEPAKELRNTSPRRAASRSSCSSHAQRHSLGDRQQLPPLEPSRNSSRCSSPSKVRAAQRRQHRAGDRRGRRALVQSSIAS